MQIAGVHLFHFGMGIVIWKADNVNIGEKMIMNGRINQAIHIANGRYSIYIKQQKLFQRLYRSNSYDSF